MKARRFHRLWVRLVCMVLSCLLITGFFQNLEVHAAEGNFTMNIANSSFETAATDGSPTNWNTTSTYGNQPVTVSKVRAYDQASSMLIKDVDSTSSIARFSDKIDIDVDESDPEEYTASAYAYIESGTIGINLVFYDQNGAATIMSPTGTPQHDKWTKISNTAKAPAGTKKVAVMFYSGVAANDTIVYVDAVSIGRTVLNPSFERSLSGWNVSAGAVTTDYMNGVGHNLKLDATGSATSSKVPISNVTATTRVGATAKVYLTLNSKVSIYLRFENATGNVIEFENAFEGAASTNWNTVSVSGSPPTDTTLVSIYLKTTAGAYVDDVTLDRPNVYKFGTQIWNNNADVAVFGKSANNIDIMYVGSSVYPSKLSVYNARTGYLLGQETLADIEGIWGMTVATDNSLYIGTANKKRLYKYVPGTVTIASNGDITYSNSILTPITLPTDMDIIWDVTAGSSGKIYGGTSGTATTATVGKAFQYSNGVATILNGPSNLKYVRSIAYASDTELFLGMGTPGKIMRTNPSSGTAPTDYLTTDDIGSSYVIGLDYIPYAPAPRLFAKTGDERMLVLKNSTATPPEGERVTTLSGFDSSGVSMVYPGTSKVYYTKGKNLYSYDIMGTMPNAEVNLGYVGGSAVGYTFLTDSDGITRLYATLSTGIILKYKRSMSVNDPATIDTTVTFEVEKSPNKIRSLVKGPNDKIYTSGFLRGGMGIYDPDTGDLQSEVGAGQAENMTTSGSNLYMGIYPGALVKKYDTGFDWDEDATPPNPMTVFQSPGGDHQDRPFGMLAVPAQQKLYVGTVASTNEQIGAFTVYDLQTANPSPALIKKDIVQNQSVISLAYKNNKVYGGTSIYGGLGSTYIPPQGTAAKVFVWDTNWNTNPALIPNPVPQFIPAPNRTIISDLIEGPNGLIWGIAESKSSTTGTADLFTINPSDGNSVKLYPNKFASLPNLSWLGGKMIVGNDGNIYVSSGGKLYAVDPDTVTPTNIEVKELISSGVWLLTADKYGDLYYVNNETNLFKYDK